MIKSLLGKLLLTVAIMVSVFAGMMVGTELGLQRAPNQISHDGQPPEKINPDGKLVSVDRFIAKYAPTLKRISPYDSAVSEVIGRKLRGEISIDEDVHRTATILMDSPKYRKLADGITARYDPESNAIVVGPDTLPELLAHEIFGHGSRSDTHSSLVDKNLLETLLGFNYEREQDAWDRAKKSAVVKDPSVEAVQMAGFREIRDKARLGAYAGAFLGLGLCGLGLLLLIPPRRILRTG